MPNVKKLPPNKKERVCGNCKYYKLILIDDLYYPWSGPFVCKSAKQNPDKKDPKTGPLKYDQKPCKNWEF